MSDNKNIIKSYLYNHPIYKDLPREELEEAVNNIYEKHKDDDLEQLNEFVDMYMLPVGGWGNNRGNSVAYGQGYAGGSGGSVPQFGMSGINTRGHSNALGGIGGQGVRVYGYNSPNGVTPGQGVAPIGNDAGKDDPAVVIVPPKKSNYEPWKIETTPEGYRINDIERGIKSNDREEIWNSPLGDVVRALEDYGYDANTVLDMTQEEIEDLIVNILKKENKEKELTETFKRIKSNKINDIIKESFTLDELEEERKKRKSKTQDARHILAHKHQQKKAEEKKHNSRSYVLDQFDIEKLMSKFNYVYDDNLEKWVQKKKQDKQELDTDNNKKSEGDPYIKRTGEDPYKKQVSPEEEEYPSKKQVSPEEEEEDPSKKQYNKDETKIENNDDHVKLYQARFILAVVYDLIDYVKYNKNIPLIPNDEVVSQMTKRGFYWNEDNNFWYTEDLTIPNELFNIGENKKSIIARSYAAHLFDKNAINIDNESKQPILDKENVISKLENKNYVWSESLDKWQHIEKLEESYTLLCEALKLSKQIGFDPIEAEEMSARYLLRSIQLEELKTLYDQYGENSPKVNDKIEELKDYDPTLFKTYPNTSNPIMDYDEIENRLSQRKYDLKKIDNISYWSDNNGVPSILKNMLNETLETYTGRGILASNITKNGAKYIKIKGDISNPDENYKPILNRRLILDSMKSNGFAWSKNKGWIEKPEDFEREDIESGQMDYFDREEELIDQYKDSDWDVLSWRQKKEYKEKLADQNARKILGIRQKNWPTGNDILSQRQRQAYRNKVGIHYKFDPKTKTFVKREHPIPMSGDWVDMKSSLGSISRTLGNSALLGGGLLGAALKGLWEIGKSAQA